MQLIQIANCYSSWMSIHACMHVCMYVCIRGVGRTSEVVRLLRVNIHYYKYTTVMLWCVCKHAMQVTDSYRQVSACSVRVCAGLHAHLCVRKMLSMR